VNRFESFLLSLVGALSVIALSEGILVLILLIALNNGGCTR
jgi:hypothetical protein